MADKKRSHDPKRIRVTESPIADVTANRHPSESEKHWAEKTLLPALENIPKSPSARPPA